MKTSVCGADIGDACHTKRGCRCQARSCLWNPPVLHPSAKFLRRRAQLHRVNRSVRFITTHGSWHSVSLKAACVLGFNAPTLFGGSLVFKFGNDSVTANAIRASISGRKARVSERENMRRHRGLFRCIMSSTTSVPRQRLCRRSSASQSAHTSPRLASFASTPSAGRKQSAMVSSAPCRFHIVPVGV